MSLSTYHEFIATKRKSIPDAGFDATVKSAHLFPFQRRIVAMALRKGRFAIFADTGLGKTRMQLTWAKAVVKHTGRNVLILAPLAVAQQTIAEAHRIGIHEIAYCRHQEEVQRGITITNYEMLEHFDPSQFVGVVLDESSRIKSYDSKTRDQVLSAFAHTPYRLACTATPAPNDYMELGNHAEFVGAMTRLEMLAMYFTHDGGETSKWRLKGHAQGKFWEFVATWAIAVRKPSDMGYDDSRYDLPPLNLHERIVAVDPDGLVQGQGMLFYEAQTLNDQRAARKASTPERVRMAAEIVAAEPYEQWLIWCELNDESTALAAAIPGAVEMTGSDSIEHKEACMVGFAEGRIRILVSKPSICGFGMNFQRCARTIFVGVSHSFEMTYQAIRRFWRFGQTRPVDVYLIYSDAEGAVARNLRRKEADAQAMQDAMVAQMKSANGDAIMHRRTEKRGQYKPTTNQLEVPTWLH